ncbi:AI-2E family transporter [Microvirga flavescens]|uniref:AI-2E family transporter n=1 Tax=Microvirga flavescens TaxID=2249811 RepID=UPI000DD56B34|nr:AI-2E family transporter [Microvirga flavescens]
MQTDIRQPASTDAAPRGKSLWSGLSTPLTVIVVLLGLAFAWLNAGSLLLIFAAALFATFLDACTRALAPVLPIGRAWRLSLVVTALTGLVVFALVRGIGQVPEQARMLLRVMDAQLDVLQKKFESYGIDILGPEGARDFFHLLPEPGILFGHAQTALGTASAILVNTIFIAFLGLFLAAHPEGYRAGLLCLVPVSYRGRVREIMGEMGYVMRGWLLGQLVRTALVMLTLWLAFYLLGLPSAFLLALQAGLSNFIPYIGPLVAGVPVALVAMPLGTPMLAWAMAIYFVIQNLDGYVIGPLVHREAVQVPPAWTLVGVVILGAAFGVMGMALATPLLAIARVGVLRFYVEDWLGDRPAA